MSFHLQRVNPILLTFITYLSPPKPCNQPLPKCTIWHPMYEVVLVHWVVFLERIIFIWFKICQHGICIIHISWEAMS